MRKDLETEQLGEQNNEQSTKTESSNGFWNAPGGD